MSDHLQPIDHSALRTNQAMIIAILLAAFVGGAPVLVIMVGVIMLFGTALGKPGFLPVVRALRALGKFPPDVILDHLEPHRFAQGLGAVVLSAATVFFFMGLSILAWLLVWMVVALAGLNLFGGFCVGCAFYYWLNRLGVPGFSQVPPPGALPGRRPPAGK